MSFDLTGHDLFRYILGAGASLTVGALIGAFYFLTLRWNVSMFAARRSLLLALTLQLGRFAATATVLAVVAVYAGAFPLLVATAGILAARTAVVRFGVQP